jgi:hypothetical protein
LTDTFVASDVMAYAIDYVRFLGDTADILDSVIGYRTKLIESSVSDADLVSDATATFMTYGRTPSDAAVTSDAVSSVSLAYNRVITDSVGSSDSSSSLVTR